jgi:hypothetical protein
LRHGRRGTYWLEREGYLSRSYFTITISALSLTAPLPTVMLRDQS